MRVPFAAFDDADSTSQLSDYPPGFSALIIAAAPGGDEVQGGRRVAIGGAALLAGGIVLLMAEGAGALAGLAGALAFLATPAFLGDYSIVLSEGPFLPLLLGVLGLLGLEDPPALLVALACTAGVMVRYVGLFLALGAGWSLVRRPGTPAARMRRAALATGLPLLVFLAWNHLSGGARSYQWNSGFPATAWEGVGTVSGWLAPWFASQVPRLALALALLAALAVLMRPGTVAVTAGGARLRGAAGILAACFLFMMTFSRLFADSAIIFDDRLLSPLLLLGIVATASAVGEHWSRWPSRTRAIVVAIAGLWLAGTAWRTRPLVRDLLDDGWGYASRDWQGSDLAGWLREGGARYELFSDNAPATWSLVHRPSRELPQAADSATIAQLRDALAARHGAIIGYADQFNPGQATGADFAKRLGWQRALATDEGTVWLPAGGVAAR